MLFMDFTRMTGTTTNITCTKTTNTPYALPPLSGTRKNALFMCIVHGLLLDREDGEKVLCEMVMTVQHIAMRFFVRKTS